MITFLRDFFVTMNRPCRGQSELLSVAADGGLRRGQAAGLRAHLLLCAGCRAFRRQLNVLRTLARQITIIDDSQPGMPQQARQRLLSVLKSNNGKSSPPA